MTPKELAALAKACRKAGIKHYKCGDVEFTLDDNYGVLKNTKKASNDVSKSTIESDEISDEALLMWSVLPVPAPETQ